MESAAAAAAYEDTLAAWEEAAAAAVAAGTGASLQPPPPPPEQHLQLALSRLADLAGFRWQEAEGVVDDMTIVIAEIGMMPAESALLLPAAETPPATAAPGNPQIA